LIFNSADCSSHPAEITANVEPVRQPDCTYRAILKWSVNYDIDILESLHKFEIYLYKKDDLLNIAPPFSIQANNIVCFGGTIDNICIRTSGYIYISYGKTHSFIIYVPFRVSSSNINQATLM